MLREISAYTVPRTVTHRRTNEASKIAKVLAYTAHRSSRGASTYV